MFWAFWIYLAIALISGILLIVVSIIGGLFDLGGVDVDMDPDVTGMDFEFDGTPSHLGVPITLFALTMLGSIGSILSSVQGLSPWIVLVCSIGGSILLSVIMFFAALKLIERLNVNAVENLDTLKGKIGRVELTIPKGKEGQVVFASQKTGRLVVPATAKQAIPEDTRVKVIEVLGDTIRVKPIEPIENKPTKGKKGGKKGKKKEE